MNGETNMDNNIIFEMSMSESLIMDFLWKTDKGKNV